MKSLLRYNIMVLMCFPLIPSHQQPTPSNDDYVYDTDDNEDYEHNVEIDGSEVINASEKGMYLGSPCESSCNPKLLHVHCSYVSGMCECDKNYPVKLNPSTGCGKPKRLGEQCYYGEACRFSDQHALCVQVHHNAICQCKQGYHLVSMKKPSKRIFCAEDVDVMKTNFSTLAGVLSGIAVLSGLICFVLRLFNQNKYSRPHRYGNAGIAPPIFFTNDPGSRRPSLTSIHSVSSVNSFSARKFEKDRELKEERELQRRFARMTSENHEHHAPTPSPKSTDDLLPPLMEDKQVPLATEEDETIGNNCSSVFHDELPSTSKQNP